MRGIANPCAYAKPRSVWSAIAKRRIGVSGRKAELLRARGSVARSLRACESAPRVSIMRREGRSAAGVLIRVYWSGRVWTEPHVAMQGAVLNRRSRLKRPIDAVCLEMADIEAWRVGAGCRRAANGRSTDIRSFR